MLHQWHAVLKSDSQAAQKEYANQLYLPLSLHIKIPNKGQWHKYSSEIRGHVERPKDRRY